MKSACGLGGPSQNTLSVEDDLYTQCFASPKAAPERKQEPREIFARVLKQVETMELRQYARTDREVVFPRGYVFAIWESGTDFVTIGHGGRASMTSILKRMQLANPHKLEVIAVLRRYSFDDARALCDLILTGMAAYRSSTRGWLSIENCKQKIHAMFARIDKLESDDQAHPQLDRQRSIIGPGSD